MQCVPDGACLPVYEISKTDAPKTTAMCYAIWSRYGGLAHNAGLFPSHSEWDNSRPPPSAALNSLRPVLDSGSQIRAEVFHLQLELKLSSLHIVS